MANIRKHFDSTSIAVIILTLVLFVAAILAKGLTHDVLLEAGVFLVSAKLILQTYKNSVATGNLEAKLEAIHITLQGMAGRAQGEELPKKESPPKTLRATGSGPAAQGFMEGRPSS